MSPPSAPPTPDFDDSPLPAPAAAGADPRLDPCDLGNLHVWATAVAGEFNFLNATCRRYLGLAPDACPPDGWFDFVHEGDRARVMAAWTDALATAETFEADFRLRAADGTHRWFLGRAVPRRRPDGSIERWAGTSTSIEFLKQEQERLAACSRAKDIFLATLSHELRTPLTPVLMTVTALAEDGRLPADVRDQLALARLNICIAARLIDDLLDLSGIAHGRMKIRTQPCDLHAIIDQAVAIVEGEGRTKGCRLERNYGAKRSGADADPARIQQVIWNILHNAIKFSPGGGSIRITTRDLAADGATPARIQIEITDSGIGISPDVIEKIFLPFEQAACLLDRPRTGIGLGLAIARAIVGQHGGTIVARSGGPRLGATFLIELPAMAPPPEVTAAAKASAPTAGASRRILLVEDHGPTLKVMCDLLRREGHSVTGAGCVADAILAAQDASFDLLISDLGLPDGSGCDLMAALAKSRNLRGIALTGYGMDGDKADCIAAGFRAHLTKPVDMVRLREMIERCCQD